MFVRIPKKNKKTCLLGHMHANGGWGEWHGSAVLYVEGDD